MIKIEFEIKEINMRRLQRGAQWIKVNVFEDGEFTEWLWMDRNDIKKNKEKFGADSFKNELQPFIDKANQ